MKQFVDIHIAVIILFSLIISGCESKNKMGIYDLIIETDSERVIECANKYLHQGVTPIVNFRCERSLGTKNDFYSEGDYWWPNPNDPDGPYIRRDGLSNPDYFKDHREAMRNMSIQVATLTAAYKITRNKKYSDHAILHLQSWFVDHDTRMNPNMNYAQAIKGICSGRGVGLIDGIHLVEPVQAVMELQKLEAIDKKDLVAIKVWFDEFLNWMTTHEYGIDERDRANNHGTCWVMQASQYAKLTGNQEILEYCFDRYKTVLIPNQMAEDGSFPLELKRTKPYGYSLFNFDIMSSVCKILSTDNDSIWNFALPDGRGIKKGAEFIYPYIKDKRTWPYEPDIMYWEEWPARHPGLLFIGSIIKKKEFISLWKSLPALPSTEEGLRNFPIREPILWFD